MTLGEAAQRIGVSEVHLKRVYGDRDYDMVEVIAIRDSINLNKLDLMERFWRYHIDPDGLTDEILKELQCSR